MEVPNDKALTKDQEPDRTQNTKNQDVPVAENSSACTLLTKISQELDSNESALTSIPEHLTTDLEKRAAIDLLGILSQRYRKVNDMQREALALNRKEHHENLDRSKRINARLEQVNDQLKQANETVWKAKM